MGCIFCEFINGKKNHVLDNDFVKNKSPYPLIPVFEDKNIFSFLSIPDNTRETHLLIIPKEHHEFIEDMPEEALNKIFPTIARITGLVRKNYGDCQILLNNGKNADQYIKHIHFHIIPKNSRKLVLWNNLSHKKFEELSSELIDIFKHTQ